MARSASKFLTATKLRPSEANVDVQSFTKAFVAELVKLNVEAVHPHDVNDRRAFAKVVQILDLQVKGLLKKRAQQHTVLAVVKIANELRPGNTGTFEGFEAALRSLQLTFTASPNPFYDDITFPVSKTQARSFSESISPFHRELAHLAAKAFVAARKQEKNA